MLFRTYISAISALLAIGLMVGNAAGQTLDQSDQKIIEESLNEHDIKTVSFWSFNYINVGSANEPQPMALNSIPSIWPRIIAGFGMPDIFNDGEMIHSVRRGDTLSAISIRYGVSIQAIKNWNNLSGSLIQIGQKLVLRKDGQGKRVTSYEKSYKANLPYLSRIFNRSQKYIHFILGELEKRGMPTELALLPMIESAYYPVAYSRAHAAGLWQFIPSTGKNYGLEQNWWRDERRDIIASTKGALDYLQGLHAEFDDWQLVLAAYNWGENGLRRSIKRNKKRGRGTRYSDLKMPRETRNYVPKLQAMKNIVIESHLGTLTLPHVADYAYFTPVTAPNLIDIKLAADLAGIDLEEFEMLNPSHNRPVFTTDGKTPMLIPSNRVDLFNENLKNYSAPITTWGTYEFKKGDTLSQTAEQFGIKLDKLRAINGLKPYFPIQVGQSILVPWIHSEQASNLSQTWTRPEFTQASSQYGKEFIYRIKRGDTLSGIAKRYGVSVKALKNWNGLKTSIIRVGKKLIIYKDLAVPRVSKMLES